MMAATAPIYHDLQGLEALRTSARNTPSDAVGEVAAQFESLFLQMMLKSMRDATIEGGLFDSNQLEMYQQIFDQQLSLDLSRDGALGLSDILVDQLGGEKPIVENEDKPQPFIPLRSVPTAVQQQVIDMLPSTATSVAAANRATSETRAAPENGTTPVSDTVPVTANEKPQDWRPSTPEEYIRAVWANAVAAAKPLGLDPAVLVAQSALETGWGKKVIKAADGSNSFNLFGIKAGGSWRGDSAAVNTLEFRDGVGAMEKAAFRVYDSIGDSFSDYVDFLKSNPRYQQALEKTADNREFLTEIQDAGYATDPQYAEKILSIIGKGVFGAVMSELKNL